MNDIIYIAKLKFQIFFKLITKHIYIQQRIVLKNQLTNFNYLWEFIYDKNF